MARKCLLFAYGTLMPGLPGSSPPRSLSQHWPDRIKGRLFDLGAYPGVIEVGTAPTYVEGATLEIDEDELRALDEYEDVESGEFTRRTVTTESGHLAFVYEYTRPVPAKAQFRVRWK